MEEKSFVYERPWLYPEQHDALFNDAKVSICNASTKSGKSHGARLWLFEQALKAKPGSQVWWLAPSVRQAFEIGYEEMLFWLRPMGEEFYSKNNNDRTIRLNINDVRIAFHTDDDPDNLYGRDVSACIIDEGSRVSEAAWTAVLTTLTYTDGPVRIIGNVKGKTNWTWDLKVRAEAGDDWYCEHCGQWFTEGMHSSVITFWHAAAAGIVDPEVVRKRRRDMSERAFKELYLSRPGESGDNPFGTEAIERCIAPMSNADPIAYGCDLGRRKNLTVLTGLDQDGRVCRVDAWRAEWDHTIQRIVEKTKGVPCLVDETGQGDVVVNLMRSAGGNKIEGQGFWNARVKANLFERLAVAIQRGEVHFPRGEYRDQLHGFTVEETDTRTLYKPGRGLGDDYVDSLTLALAMWDRVKSHPLAGRKPPKLMSMGRQSTFRSR